MPGGRCLLWGGVSDPGGGSPCQGGSGKENPPGLGEPLPPPVNRMTDRCKNITLAKTSFRPVKISTKVQVLLLYQSFHCTHSYAKLQLNHAFQKIRFL